MQKRKTTHNSLVISLSIANTLVRCVLIDTGSSTNLMTLDTIRAMGLSEAEIVKKSTVLVGFNGGAEHTSVKSYCPPTPAVSTYKSSSSY